MPRTTAPSTNPRILSGYTPYAKPRSEDGSAAQSKSSVPTTDERRQLLLDDPHARDVQPEQVTCVRCTKTVRLQKGKMYHLAHWLDHRWRCDRATADPQPRAKCRTLAERKAILEADADAMVVEPDRIVCGRCVKEVKLRKGRAYGLSCWNQHKMSCQPSSRSPIPSGSSSGSTSPFPLLSEMHTLLASDPLVATINVQRVKCALCLAWVDVGGQKDLDVNAWRRHRTTCVSDNFATDKDGRTRPRFFRSRHRLASTSEASEIQDGSSDAEEQPPSANSSPSSKTSSVLDRTSTTHAIRENVPCPSRSVSPPPLSFSATTSTSTSVASTPIVSPSRRSSLFPNSRHLPLPNYTSVGLSRYALDKHNHEGHQFGVGALGLHGLHLSSPRSLSPSSDSNASPPPYLERTPISLPIPKRYWRFESID
ncbi:hypothetical protein K439DRAFT_1414211 [Ramaria rubella]|nr:hypothetical protein K439DRAFT_1414211 [Ramaria rubella]